MLHPGLCYYEHMRHVRVVCKPTVALYFMQGLGIELKNENNVHGFKTCSLQSQLSVITKFHKTLVAFIQGGNPRVHITHSEQRKGWQLTKAATTPPNWSKSNLPKVDPKGRHKFTLTSLEPSLHGNIHQLQWQRIEDQANVGKKKKRQRKTPSLFSFSHVAPSNTTGCPNKKTGQHS